MSIDLSKVVGWDTDRGALLQVTDTSGRVVWAVPVAGEPVVLEVEKITSNTYAGETTYTGEQFILLDIYPKTNGTVKVTYGGLTKTITDTSGAAEPNAQEVFFGKFNGVSDSVATPASGTLKITGDYSGFGLGVFSKSKDNNAFWQGITAFTDWGVITRIEDNAFGSALNDTGITGITSIILPETLIYVGDSPFHGITDLTSVAFENPEGWRKAYTDSEGREYDDKVDVSDTAWNAEQLTTMDLFYNNVYWYRQA